MGVAQRKRVFIPCGGLRVVLQGGLLSPSPTLSLPFREPAMTRIITKVGEKWTRHFHQISDVTGAEQHLSEAGGNQNAEVNFPAVGPFQAQPFASPPCLVWFYQIISPGNFLMCSTCHSVWDMGCLLVSNIYLVSRRWPGISAFETDLFLSL